MGYMAERITETALEAGVPVYEDDSLATLLTQLKLGAEIPRELYQAIVEIYIYFLGYIPAEKEQKEQEAGQEAVQEGEEGSAPETYQEMAQEAPKAPAGEGQVRLRQMR